MEDSCLQLWMDLSPKTIWSTTSKTIAQTSTENCLVTTFCQLHYVGYVLKEKKVPVRKKSDVRDVFSYYHYFHLDGNLTTLTLIWIWLQTTKV